MQRVAIARALMAEPELILADEPTGNLDSRTGHEILGVLQGLAVERSVTVIVATHDLSSTSYADRIVSMQDGRIQEDSAPPAVGEVA